jgi:GNAT superfamily N-acetyltransferase
MTNGLHERPFGLLEDVFVEPDHRGGEIGTALVKRVIAEAKRRRCYKLIATSRHARDRVHALYARLGFTDHGKEFRMDFA